MIRVLLADDQALVRTGFRMILENAVEATRRICAGDSAAQTRVLILPTFDLDEYVYAALCAGASGFLLKDTLAPDLLSAIRVVGRGDTVVAPSVTRRLLERYVSTGSAQVRSTTGLDVLTEREREVLGLMAHGLTNTEIAGRLYLSEGTVKTHVHRVLSKLGLRDRVQAVVCAHERAYESGLVRAGAAESP